jgi:hypothetical protein
VILPFSMYASSFVVVDTGSVYAGTHSVQVVTAASRSGSGVTPSPGPAGTSR